MSDLHVESPDWTVERSPSPRPVRGVARGRAGARAGFPAEFLATESTLAEELTAAPRPATRGRAGAPGPLTISYDVGAGEAAVLAVRHPSGALTFHRSEQPTRRARGGPARVRFVVDVSSVARPSATRGLVDRAIKAFIIKVAKAAGDELVSLVLPKLVAQVEAKAWKLQGLREGWLSVAQKTLAAGKLAPGRPSGAGRCLLFIHGTFSNAAAAYGPLAQSKFFERVRKSYGDRIYAFDHFTLSRTPEENARMLLEGLPDKEFTFDVITHSRGGLVLRNLVERSTAFGSRARRFKLGRAVLVASPNEGTPLATPNRWESTVGWVANLLELFPIDNPFTTGAAFVGNGLVWIARHASVDLPGLHSMDGDGDLLTELQQPPGPPPDAYSALVSNFQPDTALLGRMIDAGVDQFFGSANDLVVPSEGGWRIDRRSSSFIPGGRIGCFGPGGNLTGDKVTHIGFFSEKPTVDFLVRALAGDPQPLALVDPGKSLPDRRPIRGGGMPAGTAAVAPRAATGDLGDEGAATATSRKTGRAVPPLRLTVVNGDLTFERLPLLIGHYNASKLTGAASVMDERIGGSMSQALTLGDYPLAPGMNRIFVNRHIVTGKPWLLPRPKAVIVVGLGQEGSLTGRELAGSVCQAVIAWARHVAESVPADPSDSHRTRRPDPVELELAATLIGSGGSGITAGQSAQLIAQGVYEANEKLSGLKHPWPRVGRLRLIEIYLDRASEAWRALTMHGEATPERYALDDVIECGSGALPRPLDASYRGAEYDFISATARDAASGEIEIEYAVDSKRARTEIRTVSPQGRLVRDLVKTAASDANDDPQIGTTLFKLLVPVELESFLAGTADVQIELDDRTAGIPWELLDDDADREERKPEPWAIRAKLLRKLRAQEFRANPKDADGDAHMLVIGAPKCPEEYPPLPGAWKEATAVYETLAGTFASRVERLIGDAPLADGYDAREIVNALFRRGWRVVHIAGHGELPAEDGSIGGVVLSARGTFLGPAEIKAMRVVPELVFINCCHLGATSNEIVLAGGRTAPSLHDRARFASSVARELIKIGVRCVIAAGWAVDDEAAKEFAGTFYGSLLEGQRFIDAVRDARRAAYRNHEGSNTWAAYQCYGDPDWQLTRDRDGREKPSKHEFDGVTSVAGVKLALETLLVQKKHQGYRSTRQLERLGVLEERWRAGKWNVSDGVAELFARAYAAAGNADAAIAWYTRALEVASGDVSIKALEQRTNLQVRQAWKRVESECEGGRAARPKKGRPSPTLDAARATIRRGIEILERLMTEFRPTAERASLCGSAMKRLAQVERAARRSRQEVEAIQRMKSYYAQGQALSVEDKLSNFFYPAANYIAAELALNAGRTGWKPTVLASSFEKTRESLVRTNQNEPDFWSVVGQIDIDLFDAVARGALAPERAELEGRYRQLSLDVRGGDDHDWASVHDTVVFVLARYGDRATPEERRAATRLVAAIEKLVAAEGTPRPAPPRKRKTKR